MLASLIRNLLHGTAGAGALVDQGNEHAARGEHDEALALYERALRLEPDNAVAHSNRALSLHAVGRVREAWAESEWRFHLHGKTHAFNEAPPVPRWEGAKLVEGTLLVLWEQGYGDILQHLRFLHCAAARVPRVAFLCPERLAPLVRHSFPEVEVVLSRAGTSPEWRRYAAQVPLLSLPHVLQTDWETLPAEPYLRPPAGAAAPGSALEVGIAWRTSGDEPHRDCTLEDMLPLAASGARLVSLQFMPDAAEQAVLEREGIPTRAADFLATAGELARLHAIVTVDTVVLHLAGALGRPVIGLLNEPFSVRWQREGETSPWYPSARLLRKRNDQPWGGTVQRATAILRERRWASS